VLPTTRQRRESRLYSQLKHVLNLATPEGCKAELTYATWNPTGWNLNLRPVSRKSNVLTQCQQVLLNSTKPTNYGCISVAVHSGCNNRGSASCVPVSVFYWEICSTAVPLPHGWYSTGKHLLLCVKYYVYSNLVWTLCSIDFVQIKYISLFFYNNFTEY